jgi:outer membrane protein OmpA-like peptidoglycan-associated protein
VTVTVAGQSLSAIVVAGGKWSVTAAGLANGAAHVIANVSDADGNTATATQVLTVRRPAPIVHHLSELVYFAGDSAVITSSTRAKIAALVRKVPSNALTIAVHITGYIKLVGPTTENEALASARAQSVYLLMKDKVVATYTLRGVAKGLSHQVSARRVQVTISYTLPDRS